MGQMMNEFQILPLKEQFSNIDKCLNDRLHNILPGLMARNNIDMWIILSREYNEDPVFSTLVPADAQTSSRTSCLIFFLDHEQAIHCLSLCRPNLSLERFYKRVWDQSQEAQWECLKRIVTDKTPKKIGINLSANMALADGITKSLYDELINTLGIEYSKRIVSAENLCVNWLEKRSKEELVNYSSVYKVAEDIIETAFSKKVIEVGLTTTDEVEWWILQKINELGLKSWFMPTVDLQRSNEKNKRITNTVILPGDILHCDIGIEYMGLCTDTQRVAYVLKADEIDPPDNLKKAIFNCNQFQDIVTENFIEGKSGNEILTQSLLEANKRGLKAMCYTHPIGFHGHGAGPIIGLWDNQKAIPIRGDYKLNSDTCYALELNVSTYNEEWSNTEVTIFLEETIAFSNDNVEYIGKRQRDFILI